MKIRFGFVGMAALLMLSCSPKLAVKAAEPAVAPTPEVAETTVMIGPEMPVSAEEISHGKELYQNNCANCHNLVAPATHTIEQWAPILVRMQTEARLDDKEMASIRNFIHSETK